MATKVPLPQRDKLPEAILFHRENLGDPTVILQIPNDLKTDAETYVLKLDRESDISWLDYLNNSRALRDALEIEEHIIFYTSTGHVKPIEDLDRMSLIAERFMEARAIADKSNFFDRFASRRQQIQNAPAVSLFRRLLGGYWKR